MLLLYIRSFIPCFSIRLTISDLLDNLLVGKAET